MAKKLTSSLSALKNTCSDIELMWGFTIQTALNLKALFKQPQDNFDHGNNAATIVLTPGLGCNNGPMRLLGEELNEKFNIVYAPQTLGLNIGNIEIASIMLGKKAVSVLEENEKNGDLHLLGHSLGGLVSIKALMNTDRLKVRKVFTCATPFGGTEMANFVPFFKAAKQINTSGGFLPHIGDIDSMIEELIINVSTEDVFVLPQSQVPKTTLSSKMSILKHIGYKHTDFIIGEKVRPFSTILSGLMNS